MHHCETSFSHSYFKICQLSSLLHHLRGVFLWVFFFFLTDFNVGLFFTDLRPNFFSHLCADWIHFYRPVEVPSDALPQTPCNLRHHLQVFSVSPAHT